jgi:deoxyribonucleoside regulator
MARAKTYVDSDMLDVARLYFTERKKKSDIAAILGKSITHVSRMLEDARRRGMVQITIHERGTAAIEHRWKKVMPHLERVILVPFSNDYSFLLRQMAAAAARYFEVFVKKTREAKSVSIGVAGGETLFEIASQVKERSEPQLHWYPLALIGRGGLAATHVDPAVVCTVLWLKYGRHPGTLHLTTVPPLQEGLKPRNLKAYNNELAKPPYVQTALDLKLDFAFAGIGRVMSLPSQRADDNTRYKLGSTELLAPLKISGATLQKQGAVGELSYCHFDKNGSDEGREWEFFLTPKRDGVSYYRQMVEDGRPVVVTAGKYKEDQLLAALKGKLFNVWITDEVTAEELLRQVEPAR